MRCKNLSLALALTLWSAGLALGADKPATPEALEGFRGKLTGTVSAVEPNGKWFVLTLTQVEGGSAEAAKAVGQDVAVSVKWAAGGKQPDADQAAWVKALKKKQQVAVSVGTSGGGVLRLQAIPDAQDATGSSTASPTAAVPAPAPKGPKAPRLTTKPENPDTLADFKGTLVGTVAAIEPNGKWFTMTVKQALGTPADTAAKAVGQTAVVSVAWAAGGTKPSPEQSAWVKALTKEQPLNIGVATDKRGVLRLTATESKAPTAGAASQPATKEANVGEEADEAARKLTAAEANYDGRQADAPWRKEAAERIEKHRKADLAILVVDSAGKPVPNANVTVEMTRHEFYWGSAVRLPMLTGKGGMGGGIANPSAQDVAKFQEMFLKLFNKIAFVNDLKEDYRKPAIREALAPGLEWIRSKNLRLKGHLLVWPDWGHSLWAKPLAKDPAALRKEQMDRLIAKAKALEGTVHEWDVVNELKNNMYSDDSFFRTVGGLDAVVEWLHEARKNAPSARLYVTDNSILDSRAEPAWYNKSGKPQYIFVADTVEAYLKELIARKAPFDVIGFQGHFWKPAHYTPPAEIYRRLERFAQLGKDMELTEVDIGIPDPKDPEQLALQGDFTRDLLTVVFSHPKVTGFKFWGFWEGEMRKKSCALFRQDWTPKPSGQAYLDLVLNQWWTRAQGATDAAGQYKVRGFRGDYQVTVGHGDKKATVSLKLGEKGLAQTIRLD